MTKLTHSSQVFGGTLPGDNSGDTAFVGTGKINAVDNDITDAVNNLASEGWRVNNSSETVFYGDKTISTTFVSDITKTLPAAADVVTDDHNSLWFVNQDAGQNVILQTVGGDFFRYGIATGGTTYTVQPGHWVMIVPTSVNTWFVFDYDTSITRYLRYDLADVGITAPADGELLEYNSGTGDWENIEKETADLMIRSRPNMEVTPATEHTTKGEVTTNFSVEVHTEPSVDVTIGSNSVTMTFDGTTNAVSAATRGLTGMRLGGKVFVHGDGTERTSFSTATSGIASSVIKNPQTTIGASDTWAVVWEYYHNGTTDFIWIEWVAESV